jgi:hypothetical protein
LILCGILKRCRIGVKAVENVKGKFDCVIIAVVHEKFKKK